MPACPARDCRFASLHSRVIAIGVLVILAFAASSVYDAWRSYRQTVLQTDRELGNLARALAAHGARSLQTVDVVLRDTARWYADAGHALATDEISAALASRAAGLPQVQVITIVDADGIERYGSRGLTPAIDVSDRSYYVAQRTGAVDGLFVSEPLVNRVDHGRTFIMSRRLADATGSFAGIVTAVVDLADLQHVYGAMELGRGSEISVLRNDGTVIVRYPPAPDRTAAPVKAAMLPSAQAAGLADTATSGQRYEGTAPMRHLPLAVTVTRDRSVALKPWRDDTLSLAMRTLVAMLLTLLAVTVLLRQLRRLDEGEGALRESEQRYALAMEGAQEGHWDWDLASDRLFISPKMKELAGLRDDTLIRTRNDLLACCNVHPEDLPRLHGLVNDHIEGRTPLFELEYRVRHTDGEWHWLLARGRVLRDAAGKAYRFVGSAIDVTARKHAEEEKDRLEAQLRQSQKMEAIGTLAGGIAHDFNNILGAILGYGELAQKRTAEDSAARRYLDNVMQAAGRAKALVERILSFSRSGLAERAPVHVQSVIEETLELLAASLPSQVRLEKRLNCGNAAIVGDPTQLHQVAMNLFTNALQAMEHGGVLTVLLECVDVHEPRMLTQGGLAPGAYVRLVVRDTGSGIRAGALERMFDPFFTTKGVGAGTGLGLSLVHGIVTDLGGAIEVQTALGEGTSFAIWLPVSAEVEKSSGGAAREPARGHGELVMVVDDEPALVALAEEMLAELGYEPAGFHSGTAALEAFRADPDRYDAVLTDETMPDLLGSDLARELAKLRSNLPVLLMSGYTGAQLAARARAAGVRDVLRKPLTSRDIAESLARALAAVASARMPA